MNEQLDFLTYLQKLGKAMDWDVKNNVHGKPGTETIPWLHKKPTSVEDTLVAAYSYMRGAGITVVATYDAEDVDIARMTTAGDIRLGVQNGK